MTDGAVSHHDWVACCHLLPGFIVTTLSRQSLAVMKNLKMYRKSLVFFWTQLQKPGGGVFNGHFQEKLTGAAGYVGTARLCEDLFLGFLTC